MENKHRYLVIEYCFKDDEWQGSKHILGSYEDIGTARLEAGKYISANVKKMRKRYRCWQVEVQRELIYFPIKGI